MREALSKHPRVSRFRLSSMKTGEGMTRPTLTGRSDPRAQLVLSFLSTDVNLQAGPKLRAESSIGLVPPA
jgi:hypothetical protein